MEWKKIVPIDYFLSCSINPIFFSKTIWLKTKPSTHLSILLTKKTHEYMFRTLVSNVTLLSYKHASYIVRIVRIVPQLMTSLTCLSSESIINLIPLPNFNNKRWAVFFFIKPFAFSALLCCGSFALDLIFIMKSKSWSRLFFF